MKILITGDWQLESRPSCDRLDSNGKSIRFQENQEALQKMLDSARAKGCTGMIHLGDLVEERNPDSATLTAAAYVFGAALQFGWPVHAIAGNHDGAIFKQTSSSFEALEKMNAAFHAYHEITVAPVGKSLCMFIPYLHRVPVADVIAMAIMKAEGRKIDFVFAHYDYAGSTVGAKSMVLPGDKLDVSLMKALGAKVAFFGHIHKQQVVKGDCPVVFVGSPCVNDFGERNDKKGYAILDTETGDWELFELLPKRRWVQVEWRLLGTGQEGGKFGSDDIVKVVGEYGDGESPHGAFRAAVASKQVPEPFYKAFDVRKAIVATSRGIVSGESGLQSALATFMATRWPKDPLAKEALETALGALKASSPAAYDKSVVLSEVHATDFLSHKKVSVQFRAGEPLLISGKNGLGKTNLMEAVLFSLTGQVSKGLKMASLVRQGASKATVELLLHGEKGQYRIRRTVTLNSKGAAAHKVNVEMRAYQPGDRIDMDWTSLADGGVAETQAALGRLIGATFTSMRAVNFQFQRKPNPFIDAEPSERKAILAEILGLESLSKAFKLLNEDRLVKQRVKDAAEASSAEALLNCDPEKLAGFRDNLKVYEATLPVQEEALKASKVGLEAAVTKAAKAEAEHANLQGTIDILKSQAFGDVPLKDAKAKAIEAYDKTYAERATRYLTAKKRAEAKTAESAGLADLEAKLAAANAELARTVALPTTVDAAAMARIAELEKASAKAAKTAVDAKLAARAATQVKSDASSTLKAAKDSLNAKSLELTGLMGENISTCSKCGQAVDSSHIQAEIEAVGKEIKELTSARDKAEQFYHEAGQTLTQAELAEANTQRYAEDAAKDLSNTVTTAEKAAAEGKNKASAGAQAALFEVTVARSAAKDAAEAVKERDAIVEDGTKAGEAHKVAMAELDDKIAKAVVAAEAARKKAEEAELALKTIASRLSDEKDAVALARGTVSRHEEAIELTRTSIAGTKAGIEKGMEYESRAVTKKLEFAQAVLAWQIAEMASLALDPKSGLPVHLIDEKLPALADALNDNLSEFGMPEFTLSFSTQKDDGKETLDLLVDNGATPQLDVAAYSGGQLDRIEFCLRLALGDLAEIMRDVRLGFVMLDEPGTHLDDSKKSDLIRLLIERSSNGKCPIVAVVSHDKKLMDSFVRRINVTAEGVQED